MFSTPRKKKRFRGNPKTPSTPTRLRGYFNDGHWFCDCTPRLPAVKLQVKKEGANKGRRFYTCQQERKNQCEFFLWEDLAQTREKGALLTSGRREESYLGPVVIGRDTPPLPEPLRATRTSPPRQQQQQQHQGLSRQQDGGGTRVRSSESISSLATDEEMEIISLADKSSEKMASQPGSSSAASVTQQQQQQQQNTGAKAAAVATTRPEPETPTPKRKRDAFQDSEGEAELDDLFENDSETERVLAQAEQSASSVRYGDRSSPNVAQMTTPTTNRNAGVVTGADGIPTPVSRQGKEPSAKRTRFLDGDDDAGPSHTTTTTTTTTNENNNITDTILHILADQPLSAVCRRRVRDALDAHALRVEGVYRGRDAVRTALASKEVRIAELQARVADLEKARKTERARVRELMGMFGDE